MLLGDSVIDPYNHLFPPLPPPCCAIARSTPVTFRIESPLSFSRVRLSVARIRSGGHGPSATEVRDPGPGSPEPAFTRSVDATDHRIRCVARVIAQSRKAPFGELHDLPCAPGLTWRFVCPSRPGRRGIRLAHTLALGAVLADGLWNADARSRQRECEALAPTLPLAGIHVSYEGGPNQTSNADAESYGAHSIPISRCLGVSPCKRNTDPRPFVARLGGAGRSIHGQGRNTAIEVKIWRRPRSGRGEPPPIWVGQRAPLMARRSLDRPSGCPGQVLIGA